MKILKDLPKTSKIGDVVVIELPGDVATAWRKVRGGWIIDRRPYPVTLEEERAFMGLESQ